MTTVAEDMNHPWVEISNPEEGSGLVPLRVTHEGRLLYEGLGVELSENVVYFRTSDWPWVHAGDRVVVEVHAPLEVWGERHSVRVRRTATVSRVQTQALTHALGFRPRRCPVFMVYEEEMAGV